MISQEKQKEYQSYVKKKTPVSCLPVNMVKAFLLGGTICLLGQIILNYCKSLGMDKEASGGWCSIVLILISALLTGLNIYPQLAKWGGAGALVPITGFANSVTAPAIEYKKEGQVLGIGCKYRIQAGAVFDQQCLCGWEKRRRRSAGKSN